MNETAIPAVVFVVFIFKIYRLCIINGVLHSNCMGVFAQIYTKASSSQYL